MTDKIEAMARAKEALEIVEHVIREKGRGLYDFSTNYDRPGGPAVGFDGNTNEFYMGLEELGLNHMETIRAALAALSGLSEERDAFPPPRCEIGVLDKNGRMIRLGDRVVYWLNGNHTKEEYWNPEYEVVWDAPTFTLKHVGGGLDGGSHDFKLKHGGGNGNLEILAAPSPPKEAAQDTPNTVDEAIEERMSDWRRSKEAAQDMVSVPRDPFACPRGGHCHDEDCSFGCRFRYEQPAASAPEGKQGELTTSWLNSLPEQIDALSAENKQLREALAIQDRRVTQDSATKNRQADREDVRFAAMEEMITTLTNEVERLGTHLEKLQDRNVELDAIRRELWAMVERLDAEIQRANEHGYSPSVMCGIDASTSVPPRQKENPVSEQGSGG